MQLRSTIFRPPSTHDSAGKPPPRTILQHLADAGKMLAWVAPLTILIWVYAEQEQVPPPKDFSIPFALRINAPNRIVRLVTPREAQLQVTLSGPLVGLENVSRDFYNALHQPTVQITVDPKVENGKQVIGNVHIPVIPILSDDAICRNHGLSIKRCEPNQIVVEVDDLIDKSVSIAKPDGAAVQSIHFEPETVTVRAPATTWAKRFGMTKPEVQAVLDTAMIEGMDQGEHKLKDVHVRWNFPEDDYITIAPSTVEATVMIRQRDETYKLRSAVAVAVLKPATLEVRWKVDCPPTIANVTVSGPPDLIAYIRDDEKRVHAFLVIDPNKDTDGKEHKGYIKFEFDLPEKDKDKAYLLKVPQGPENEVTYSLVEQ